MTRMQANADDADFKIRFVRVWHIRVIRVPVGSISYLPTKKPFRRYTTERLWEGGLPVCAGLHQGVAGNRFRKGCKKAAVVIIWGW